MDNQKLNHVSFIMDGNGRWAQARNKNRYFGHKEGAKRIADIIKYALKKEIKHLSFFAFSTENWSRSEKEVNFLMKLLEKNLNNKLVNQANKYGVRPIWIGFEDKKIPKTILNKIKKIQEELKENNKIIVYFYFNYGFKKDCEEAYKKIKKISVKNSANKLHFKDFLVTKDVPQIDLLIRTSGEKRISNFSFYQLLYSEIIFEGTLWPDYDSEVFEKNIQEFNQRKRRYGKA